MEAMVCSRAGAISKFHSLIASSSSCKRLRSRGGLLGFGLRSPHLRSTTSVVVNANERNEKRRRRRSTIVYFSMGGDAHRDEAGLEESATRGALPDISPPQSDIFQAASPPSWIAVGFGAALLFATAFLPSVSLGPLGFLREALYIVGSPQLWQSVWYVGVFIHVLEAALAVYLARRVDPQNAGLWFWQTFFLGVFSLSSLLKKSNQKKSNSKPTL